MKQPAQPPSTFHSPPAFRSRLSAFTLVELLVVIAIIGILVALLLPAVQSAREAARLLQCKNHLKQLSLAAVQHNTAHGHYPTGGWGFGWVGDPDRGYGAEQPGGWFYNSLPYIEQQALHDMGLGITDTTQKRQAALDMVQTVIPNMTCPSRRSPQAFAVRANRSWLANTARPSNLQQGWFRTCYAVNGGTRLVAWGYGPSSLAQGDAGGGFRDPQHFRLADGLGYQRSTITAAHIRDGASNTYMLGEKHLNPLNYTTGNDWADDEPALGADDYDLFNFVFQPPMRDTEGVSEFWRFGSVHTTGFQIAFCDGSVRLIHYTIDPHTHKLLGGRADGNVIDASQL